MRNKYSFREPLNEEPDGTYITAGQMQFWLNRSDGTKMFKEGNPEFFSYYNKCRIYNLVSDIMEYDEDSAIMYWDGTKEAVSIAFPADGEVAEHLSGIDLRTESIDDYDDDGEDSWSAGV